MEVLNTSYGLLESDNKTPIFFMLIGLLEGDPTLHRAHDFVACRCHNFFEHF